MYICPECHHVFTSQGNLTYHITNQVCKNLVNNRICPSCGKSFTTKRSCQNHIEDKICVKKHHIATPVAEQSVQQGKIPLRLKSKPQPPSYENLSKDELITELKIMTTKYETLKENPQTITTNNTNNNNLIVFPAAYGKEDIKHIKQILGDIFGQLISHQTFNSIPSLFNKIHNCKQLPEYHNVYSPSERSNFAMVSDGKSFKFKPKKNIIDQIIEDKRSILNQYIDEYGDQLGKKVLEKYERYQDQIDEDPEFRKNLELEIAGLLLDMKSVIADDEKTRRLLDKVDEGQFDLTD